MLKFYIFKNKEGKTQIFKRKKGLTITTQKRLKDKGWKCVQIVEMHEKLFEFLKTS